MEINRRDIRNSKDVIVSVKDSGNGIDPSIFSNLFSKFATNSPKGTGLGLVVGSGLRIIMMSIEKRVGLHFTLASPLVT
jgi:C4-dicarboxylate-specific signal transduction histidine kinase